MSRQYSSGVRVGHADNSAFHANQATVAVLWLRVRPELEWRTRLLSIIRRDTIQPAGLGYESSKVHEDPCGDRSISGPPPSSSAGPSKSIYVDLVSFLVAVVFGSESLAFGQTKRAGLVPTGKQLLSRCSAGQREAKKLEAGAIIHVRAIDPCEQNSSLAGPC